MADQLLLIHGHSLETILRIVGNQLKFSGVIKIDLSVKLLQTLYSHGFCDNA